MIKCTNKCCTLMEWYNEPITFLTKRKTWLKAGIILETNDLILIVKSAGYKWGFPKGTIDKTETSLQCALRELQEETSVVLTEKDLNPISKIILHQTTYYKCTTTIPIKLNVEKISNIPCNDSTGVGWINKKCLSCMIKNKKISTTSHLELYIGKKI